MQGTQDLSGVVPDTTSTLRLGANATINDSSALSVGTLDLANFALTLNDQMAGLSVGQAVTLDAATEQIISADADLTLSGRNNHYRGRNFDSACWRNRGQRSCIHHI